MTREDFVVLQSDLQKSGKPGDFHGVLQAACVEIGIHVVVEEIAGFIVGEFINLGEMNGVINESKQPVLFSPPTFSCFPLRFQLLLLSLPKMKLLTSLT